MMLLDIVTFLGRFHPLVVHLPIGFLIMGLMFELLSYIPRYGALKETVSMTLLAGFISAAVACIFGYMLSLSGEYDPGILNNHKIAGIVLAIVSGILWSMTTSFYDNYVMIPRKVVTALCMVMILLLAYTGHQGGNLTHGVDYLSLETLTHQERVKPAKAEEAMIFEDVVQPMLERRCEGCHRKGKRKGGLVLSSYEGLMKGGKHGPAVVAGKPAESELYRRITLDPAHEDFMPTDGKTPLTKTETEVIRWWIENADAAKERKLTIVAKHESMIPVVASLLELPGASPLPESGLKISPVNDLIPNATDMVAVENLRKQGVTIRVMLHNPVMLDVTLPAGSGIAMRDIEKDLRAIAENVIWLNLSDNGLADIDLKVVETMSNLEKLRLERNPVSDGVADIVSNLKFLEALNVNETGITENGLMKLQQHPSLKRVYSWKTAVNGSN